MKKQVLAVVLLCVPAGVLAWQGAMAGIGVTESALQPQLERVTRQKGDGLTLSILGPKQLLAARALSPADQAEFVRTMPSVFQAVKGAWGKSGCTQVTLKEAKKDIQEWEE